MVQERDMLIINKRIKSLDRDTTQTEKNKWNLRNQIVPWKEIIIW